MSAGAGQPCRFLSDTARPGAGGRRHGGAVGHPADRPGASATLRLSACDRGVAGPRNVSESQTRSTHHARGRPARCAAQAVRDHHRFQPSLRDLSEPGAADDADRGRSAVGGRYHLHPAAGRVCVLGADPGCLFAQGCRLEAGPHAGEPAGDRSIGNSDRDAKTAARAGAPLRSRHPVRLRGVCCHPAKARLGSEHEPASQPVRQCQLRELHQDAEAGRNLRERLREPGTFAKQHRRVHRAVLQPEAAALCFRLSLAGRVRGASPARTRDNNMFVFRTYETACR